MAVIGSLSVKLGLVTVEWDKATAQAKKQAKDLQTAIQGLGGNLKSLSSAFQAVGGTAAISAAGFGYMLRSVTQMSEQTKDLATAFGLSIGKALQFQKALELTGGKAENAQKILGTLFSKINEAQEGNEKTISVFERLGLSFEELRSLTPEQSLNKVVGALSQIGDSYERIKLVKELLGKGGLGLDLKDLSSRLEDSTDKFKKAEQAVETFDAVSKQLQQSMDNLKMAFAEMVAPLLPNGNLIVGINSFKAALIGITAYAVIGGVIRLAGAIIEVASAVKKLTSAKIGFNAAGGLKGLLQAGAALGVGIGADYLLNKEEKKPEVPPMPSGIGEDEEGGAIGVGGAAKTTAPTTPGKRPELEAGKARIAGLTKEISLLKQKGELKVAALNMDKFAARMDEAKLARDEAINKAQVKYNQAINKQDLSKEQIRQMEQEFALEKQAANEQEVQARALINAERDKELKGLKLQADYQTASYALQEKGIDLERVSNQLTESQVAATKIELATQTQLLSLENQIAEAKQRQASEEEIKILEAKQAAEKRLGELRKRNIQEEEERRGSFVEGWKAAYKTYSEDAVDNFRIGQEAFTSVTSHMSSAIENFVRTGKLAFKDFARSVIQDLLMIALKAQATKLLTMGLNALGLSNPFGSSATPTPLQLSGPYAEGGEPPVGQVALVGEQGPELFIPKQAGTIVPNNKLQNLGGNQTNITNNYINAIDVKSFEDRLIGSANTIWTANKYAEKSLTVGRGRA